MLMVAFLRAWSEIREDVGRQTSVKGKGRLFPLVDYKVLKSGTC